MKCLKLLKKNKPARPVKFSFFCLTVDCYCFSCIKATEGEASVDSDDEFAEDFRPVTDNTPVNQADVPLQDEELSSSEPSSPVPPVEAKLLQGIISSAITQGLSSITNRQDEHETKGN